LLIETIRIKSAHWLTIGFKQIDRHKVKTHLYYSFAKFVAMVVVCLAATSYGNAVEINACNAADVDDDRFADFDFDNPPAPYEKEIRAADARQSIKAGSLQFVLSKFARVMKDESLRADLGLKDGYEVITFRLFDHESRKLIHDSHRQHNKDNDPSTRKFHITRVGETAQISIAETGSELPSEIDLWLRIVESGKGERIVIPAKLGGTVEHGESEIVVTSLLPGIMSGTGSRSGKMIWDTESSRNANWKTTVDLQNRGADLPGRYHLVAVTKTGSRHAMDDKHFLDFPKNVGRYQYVQLDVALAELDHFELIPFKERHTFFFNGVSVPRPISRVGSTLHE